LHKQPTQWHISFLQQVSLFSVLIWSVLKQHNNKVWGNNVKTISEVCNWGINLLDEWRNAQICRQGQIVHNGSLGRSRVPEGINDTSMHPFSKSRNLGNDTRIRGD